MSEGALRIVLVGLAAVNLGLGVWLFFPRSFYTTIGAFGGYNRHYERVNHGIDAGDSNNSWAGRLDFAALGLATVQFAALLWLLVQRGEARTP